MISALLQVAAAPAAPPSMGSVLAKPLLYVELYATCAVLTARIEPTAEASLAAMRERSRFGMAMAAMIKMMATTINNSISEKPLFVLFIVLSWRVNFARPTLIGRSKLDVPGGEWARHSPNSPC